VRLWNKVSSFRESSDCVCVCRRVLVNAGYQLSDDEEFVIYVTGDEAADDDDDYDYNADNDTDAACTARNSANRASRECCDAIIEEDWC